MTSDIFHHTLTVQPEHIDVQGHVNNVVYLQWVQDMAEAHWLAKSTSDFILDHYWVVRNHFIEYKGEAFVGDKLTLQTFVEENAGVRSVRIVEVLKGDKLLTRARSEWVLMNKSANRPVRVPKEVNDWFFGDGSS